MLSNNFNYLCIMGKRLGKRISITVNAGDLAALEMLRKAGGFATLASVVKAAVHLCASAYHRPDEITQMFDDYADWQSPRLGDKSRLTETKEL